MINNNLFEWVKLIQRFVMVILTIALCLILRTTSYEIRDLKTEIKNISAIAERGLITAEKTREEIYQQIEEFQRDGIKLHFRLW